MEEIEDGFFYQVQGKVCPTFFQDTLACTSIREEPIEAGACFAGGKQRKGVMQSLTGTFSLQWVEVGDVDVDTGANASAEEAEEGVDSSSRKVVDIQDSFRLSVRQRAVDHSSS